MVAILSISMKQSWLRLVEGAQARLSEMPSFGSTRLLLGALFGFLFFAMVYLALSSNAAMTARSLRLKQIKIAEVERENAQLRYEIAALTSPAAIDQRARQLGLGPAKKVVYADMPWLSVDPEEIMPAYLRQPRAVFGQPALSSSGDTWDALLTLLGLNSSGTRANAQTK